MDPVTHITSGVIAGNAIKSRFPHRGIIILCIISAMIPDIDNIVGLINPELYLIHHRGITHSFLGGLLSALVVSLIFRLFSQKLALIKTFIISYSVILVHIFLDLITSYGTQILYPFSRTRYALSCVFIIDPFFTLTLIVLLISSFIVKKRSKTIAVVAIFFMFLYPAMNLGIKIYAKKYVVDRLAVENVSHDNVRIEPELFSPGNWKVIVENDDYYMLTGISLFEQKRPFIFSTYQKADIVRMLILAEKASIFRTFAWFAAYPVMNIEEQGKTERMNFSDLRFYSTLPMLKDRFNNKKNNVPFSLFANINEDGILISWEYSRPGRQKVIEYVE